MTNTEATQEMNRDLLKRINTATGTGKHKIIRKKVKHNMAFNRRCFICGGAVIKSGEIWHCLAPGCESEFREVV